MFLNCKYISCNCKFYFELPVIKNLLIALETSFKDIVKLQIMNDLRVQNLGEFKVGVEDKKLKKERNSPLLKDHF